MPRRARRERGAANYKSVWKAESKPSLSSHLTGYINDGKFEPSSLVVKGA